MVTEARPPIPSRWMMSRPAAKRVDLRCGADDRRRRAAQGFGVLVDDDATLVDDEDVLEQVAHLVDQVGGEDDGARVLGVVLEQPVVEDVPGDRVEAEVGLVEEGHRRPAREADDHADRGELSARELLHPPVERHAEVVDQPVGEVLIPLRRRTTARCGTRA